MSKENQIRVIEVVPHNPNWKKLYLEEVEVINQVLGAEIINIHHVGSTAIPGIYAKPVIDILVEVKEINIIDSYNEAMSKIGFIAKGENGIIGRRYFLKGVTNRTHHIHIFQTGNAEIKRHLNFRDYMIAHPEEAKCYEELKKELANSYRFDSIGYTAGKSTYIQEIDIKAQEWAARKQTV
jgi:GrpB-like predicted nucleotidyltransferase (UPF0157 family)